MENNTLTNYHYLQNGAPDFLIPSYKENSDLVQKEKKYIDYSLNELRTDLKMMQERINEVK